MRRRLAGRAQSDVGFALREVDALVGRAHLQHEIGMGSGASVGSTLLGVLARWAPCRTTEVPIVEDSAKDPETQKALWESGWRTSFPERLNVPYAGRERPLSVRLNVPERPVADGRAQEFVAPKRSLDFGSLRTETKPSRVNASCPRLRCSETS
jgi:hypothetical protein